MIDNYGQITNGALYCWRCGAWGHSGEWCGFPLESCTAYSHTFAPETETCRCGRTLLAPMRESRTLPEGTLVHIKGIPVRVVGNVTVETHSANWPLIDDAAGNE